MIPEAELNDPNPQVWRVDHITAPRNGKQSAEVLTATDAVGLSQLFAGLGTTETHHAEESTLAEEQAEERLWQGEGTSTEHESAGPPKPPTEEEKQAGIAKQAGVLKLDSMDAASKTKEADSGKTVGKGGATATRDLSQREKPGTGFEPARKARWASQFCSITPVDVTPPVDVLGCFSCRFLGT